MTHRNDSRHPQSSEGIRGQEWMAIRGVVQTPVWGTVLPVLDARSLIEVLGLQNAIRVLRIHLAFPAEVFDAAVQPMLDGCAEFMQLLPVPEAGLRAEAGGQLRRGLVAAIRALDFRRAQILPRGVAPETIGALAHRWTYAVFVASLLREANRVCDGMRVGLSMGAGVERAWVPAAGSMRSGGAMHYRAELQDVAGPPDALDPALAWRLFERWVPANIRDWLEEDLELMDELRACLTGQVSGAGVLGTLVARWTDVGAPKVARAETATPGHASAPASGTVQSLEVAVAADTSTAFLADVKADEPPSVRPFMDWLRDSVRTGALPVNAPDDLVHRVPEGLLLVTPHILRRYVKQRGPGGVGGDDAAKQLLRDILRAGWHVRTAQGANFLGYEERRPDVAVRTVQGIVIRDAGRILTPLPDVHPSLVRLPDGPVTRR